MKRLFKVVNRSATSAVHQHGPYFESKQAAKQDRNARNGDESEGPFIVARGPDHDRGETWK